jgi:hypothetical protein
MTPSIPHCQESIEVALAQSFGNHPDNAEIAKLLAPSMFGKTPVQANFIMGRMLRGPLSSEVSVSLRPRFRRAVMRGLRAGKCLKHQQHGSMRVARFGAAPLPNQWTSRSGEVMNRPVGLSDAVWQAALEGEGWSASSTSNGPPPVDPNLIMGNIFDLFQAGLGFAANVANAESSKNMLEAALAAGGATQGTINGLQPSLNSASSLVASAAGQTQSGLMSQTDFEAAVTAEAEKLAAAAVEEQDGKLSSGAIAGIAVGSVAGIALLGFLIAKAFGNRNMHYGGHALGHPAFDEDEEEDEFMFMDEEMGQAAAGCGCGG